MYGARIDVVSGNFVTAKPYGIRDGVDFQLTGEVRTVDTDAIQRHLDNHNIVLLGPTGYSTTGEVFNLLAEEVATRTAIHLKADKLIFLSPFSGLKDKEGDFITELSLPQLQEYVNQNKDLEMGMKSLLNISGRAIRAGVSRVHFLPCNQDGALLEELFTHDGIGMMLASSDIENLREANQDDVGGILQLTMPLEEEGIDRKSVV